MDNRNAVSFIHCRVGTRLEFQIGGYGKVTQGVVKAVTSYGARNYLVLLSEYMDADGTVHGEYDFVTGSTRRVNLAHATRILSHGTGPLVFDADNTNAREALGKSLARVRADGSLRRAGKKLVVQGSMAYAPGVMHDLVTNYLLENQAKLGIAPWELVNGVRLLNDLVKHGICQYRYSGSGSKFPDFATGGVLHFERMKKFFRQRLNTYKLDLVGAERERIAEEERFEREEMERDIRRERKLSGYLDDEPANVGSDYEPADYL